MRTLALLALVLAGALTLAGCTGYSGDSASAVQQWAANAPWGSDNSQIISDLTSLHEGLIEHQLLSLRTACAAFPADVGTLYDTLPTPDNRLTNELNSALTTFDEAATNCYAASSFTSATFKKYERQLAAATATYHAATERLASFGVK